MENIFKKNLLEKKQQIGLWSNLCSEITADIIAGAGFDWILLDMEHSANDIRGVLSQAQAIQAKNKSEVLVRPPWNDPIKIKLKLLICF